MPSRSPTELDALPRQPAAWSGTLALLLLAGCETSPADPKEQAAATDSGEQTETDTDTGPIPVDADGDGVPEGDDCDDTDPSVFPGADERCNGVDDDCDDEVDEGALSTFYSDEDEDGYGDPDHPEQGCEPPDGAVTDASDCDDEDAAVNPEADEICNERDDDCDGDIDEDGDIPLYADADGDGWGDSSITASGCPEPGWTDQPGDCDDGDADAHPGMPSDMCDGVDSDCDGDVDEDSKAGWDLFSVNTGDGNVYDVDSATAALSSVCSVSTDIRINSMDVSENMVSIVHIARDKQIAIFDACTGSYTVIGAHGAGGIGGVSFGPDGRLFGIGGESDALWEFDLGTGLATQVGPLGIDIGSNGLAWDCTTQTMYGADTLGDRIFEIDLTTGAAQNERSTDVPFESVGLEFDRASGELIASTGGSLYTVDPATGNSTYVGPFSAYFMDDLAWHPACP
jgi:hypothetical protein